MLLQTPLGSSHVLAHSGGDRLFLLNASAAELWQLHQLSNDQNPAEALIQKLMVDYGLSKATASSQIENLLLHWRQSGLLDYGADTVGPNLAQQQDWVITPAFLETTKAMSLTVMLAGLYFGLIIEDGQLSQRLEVLLSSVLIAHPQRLAHQLALTGNATQWQLSVNDPSLYRARARKCSDLCVA